LVFHASLDEKWEDRMAGYVIVGAGSAGCVLAARLTEDPSVEVTLIEAGGPDSAQEIHIPIALAQLWKSQYDWDYMSQPEPGLDGRYVYLPRGKTLGGSSSLNAMIYIRGHRADYDVGPPTAPRAGATTRFCPISARRKPTSAATTSFTASSDRFRSQTGGRAIR
jgi:choline dehydrogenase-like flavoprotein